MRDRIETAYRENAEAMRERYLTAEECCGLDERSSLLWNRNASHDDFLSVRLGQGDVPFQAPIEIPKERFTMINDSLADKPQVIRDNFRMLKDVPVTVDLLERRLAGIAGGENRKAAISVARSMIAQIAASNCYTDVKIAIIYDEASDIDRGAWDFALWLPHVWSGDRKIRYIATNQEERGDVFYALTQTMRNRSEDRERGQSLKPRFVLFVTDPTLLDGEAISHYVFSRDRDLGLSTVMLSRTPEELPNECECVIQCDQQFRGMYDTRTGREDGTAIRFDEVSHERLMGFAKALGRVEVIESEQDGEIPNALSFFDMFEVQRPQELNAPERWKKANSIATMKALVGFRNGNTPCYLDINEKYHGPHGLVAGTTGSGKSETLQTYILSLAINFSPEDIGFFIIDYKGGGMANLFDHLPHMIGSISNLSGNQVKRAMVSIQSENRRRQRIFTEYGVNNINSYTSLYKSGDATEPIPHLFIIIDEFAELKREEPEFMKELISVAQVGRSLGVHLILSTQRPSGTVDENIWANSKFRLCLRVQDRQDSMDMLHRPEAAYLTQAGRCYLQVGNDEIFELFQSGFSGASYDEELGGGSLLIAQMLSVTGKVDRAGNRSMRRRKEELKLRWIGDLVRYLRETEAEVGVSVSDPSFVFVEQQVFLEAFYRRIRAAQPDYEENPFNNSRIGDFCILYRYLNAAEKTEAEAAQEIVWAAESAQDGKKRRLPELRTRTQLEVTADYLKDEAERLKRQGHMREIPKLWLPVLPEYLYLEDLEDFRSAAFDGTGWPSPGKHFHLKCVIGMADDPENQAQDSVSLDFVSGGHHMVIGTVSTGKSTFLQSVVYALAASYTPEQLNLYCLDFSARMLSVFEDLKHVGGCLGEDDLETDAVSKFFTMMGQILDRRRQLLSGTSFEDYINHNGWILPAIVVVIDSFGSFLGKTEDAYEEIMSRLVKEGAGCGIYLLVSAGGIGTQEIPNRLAENFRTGIALEMQDPFAYSDILHIARTPVLPETRVKGRGLIMCGDRTLEFQTALAARAEGGPERNDLIRTAVERMNAAWTGAVAKPLPRIPEKPVRAEFEALPEYREALADRARMPIGYDFEYADVFSLNLAKNFICLVTGGPQSGKTVFMENLMLTAKAREETVLVADIGADRYRAAAETHGFRHFSDGAGLLELLILLNDEFEARQKTKRACVESRKSPEEMFQAALEHTRIDVFVGNLRKFMEELYNVDSPAHNGQEVFEQFCEKGQGFNIFLFGEVDDRDQQSLRSYAAFESMARYNSGIRFGGSVEKDNVFSFENVRYQDRSLPQKCGTGILPSLSREERMVKVIVPLC